MTVPHALSAVAGYSADCPPQDLDAGESVPRGQLEHQRLPDLAKTVCDEVTMAEASMSSGEIS